MKLEDYTRKKVCTKVALWSRLVKPMSSYYSEGEEHRHE